MILLEGNPAATSPLPQPQSNKKENEVTIEFKFTMQSPDRGTKIGKEYFKSKFSVAREQRLKN